MQLYTDEELKQLPEFENLDEALEAPDKVLRFRAYRQENADELMKVLEFQNLQSLSASLSDVSKLLPHLSKLRDLQNLYLQACEVSVFPESVLELRSLRSLALGNNALHELPAEIGLLMGLESLNLSQNNLTKLPGNIGELTRLKTLCLSYNQIEELPESIGHLKALEWLFLDVNRLRLIPNVIGDLRNLEGLTLNSNQLTSLPDSICRLPHLKSINLENNPFELLPRELGATPEVERISIEAEKRALFMDWTYTPSTKPVQAGLADLKLFVSPTSELFPSLRAAICKDGLEDVAEIIVEHAREAVILETTVPDDYSRVGASRMGGFPDLGNPGQFPKTDGLHWIFLAQINMEEVAPFNSYLPRSGLLSFFLDSTESLNGKVVFYQGDMGMLNTIRHVGADEMLSPGDDYTQRPHRVRFGRRFSLPHSPPDGITHDLAWESYYNSEALHESVDHQINGYTFTQHESPQKLAANTLRGQPNEWVPLLQLGWDSKVGFCFWDAGTVTFCIHQEDLRRHDFSKVHVSLESS